MSIALYLLSRFPEMWNVLSESELAAFISAAKGLIERYVGGTVFRSVVTRKLFVSEGSILVPTVKLNEVQNVQLLYPYDHLTINPQDLQVFDNGLVVLPFSVTGYALVTYDAGYDEDELPADLIEAAAQITYHIANLNPQLASATVGNVSMHFNENSIPPSAKEILDNYRLGL
jgi:hypothetical protein